MNIKALMKKYQIIPRRSAGQNFLVDKNILQKIVLSADLKTSDNVLEIGPGLGILTEQLLETAKKVVSVELDRTLNYVLKQEFRKNKNYSKLMIVNQDALELKPVDIEDFFDHQPYKIVANIPYNITSKILRKFLEFKYPPTEMVLMVQKEVAERLVSIPGEMSKLAISAQFYSDIEIVSTVSRKCFIPAPEVDSSIVKLTIKNKFPEIDVKKFFQIIRISFAAKRKQLKNNLANGLHITNSQAEAILTKANIDPTTRAQQLSLDDWVNLSKVV